MYKTFYNINKEMSLVRNSKTTRQIEQRDSSQEWNWSVGKFSLSWKAGAS